MRALTICQPWASLLFVDAKRYETRSWAPHQSCMGQPFAIHAGKKPIKLKELGRELDALCIGEFGPLYMTSLPMGKVIGIATLVGWMNTDGLVDHLGQQEALVGDWSAGRYAWEFDWTDRFERPVPARGLQKIWNWEAGE